MATKKPKTTKKFANVYSGRNGNSAAMVNPKGPRAKTKDGRLFNTRTYTNKGKVVRKKK